MLAETRNPFLTGNYAPVHDELDVVDLPVAGEIPDDLEGAYMRNGPNPAFEPLAYHYPLDGDGMIHAVHLSQGKARYRNRYVETAGLKAERRAGRAVYGSVMHPVPVDPKLVGEDGDPGPFKNGAFIHVIRHAGQYLAMWEAGPAYEITEGLDTKGLWKPKGADVPLDVNAHTRLDLDTGELFTMTYRLEPPYLSCRVLDLQGRLVRDIPINLPRPVMMHDFVLTESFIVFFAAPAVFDPSAVRAGGPLLTWMPDDPTLVVVVPRDDRHAESTWFETPAFWVWHFANAFQKDGKIVVDYVRHRGLALQAADYRGRPLLFRMEIDPKNATLRELQYDDRVVELPRIDERQSTRAHRFIYAPTRTVAAATDGAPTLNALMKYDMSSGTGVVRDFGPASEIGEAVFAPHPKGYVEDDGWVMLFVHNRLRDESDLVIIDAQRFTGEPQAVISLPRRVPHGLHGSWFPAIYSVQEGR